MPLTLYTATGCAKCNVVRRFLDDHDLSFTEYNVRDADNTGFREFYASHRLSILRGKDGIYFPILFNGRKVYQDLLPILGFLQSGDRPLRFFLPSEQPKGWVGGIHTSAGDPTGVADLMAVLAHVRKSGFKVELFTDGSQPEVLQTIAEKKLGDRVIMEICGPPGLYRAITGKPLSAADLSLSIELAASFGDYRFRTVLLPFVRGDRGATGFLTTAEVAEIAELIKTVTGGNHHPFVVSSGYTGAVTGDHNQSTRTISLQELFAYRTAARRYLVKTEIEQRSGNLLQEEA
ncbi:MAG: hypothetical protein HKM93_19160 [Desulfobacteraceae bacterium]|nr:hypothetical protein [Desulfobacteraceae bacterium]